MNQISDDERRRAFSVWMRTGELPSVPNTDDVELKFNPWHDPADGRFTFAEGGRYQGQSDSVFRGGGGSGGGGGATGSGRWPDTPSADRTRGSTAPRAAPQAAPARGHVSSTKPRSQPSARTGRAERGFTGGGGSAGGAGASGSWGLPASPSTQARTKGPLGQMIVPVRPIRSNNAPTAKTLTAASPSEQFRSVVRNGYTYHIDGGGRTRRVSGALTVSDTPRRSRDSQKRAGGVDRRASDDGGHYIAARFNGPTDAFNHFAQDLNFNRGDYRALEDQWAKAKRAGKSVTVTIVPTFDGTSIRPAAINVHFSTDGQAESKRFPNTPKEKKRGK